MKLMHGIPVFGEPEFGALDQIQRAASADDRVRGAALMADNHKGYAVPIGGVIAYEGAISPSGVGYDIACGNKAVLTDMMGPELRANIGPIMDDIVRVISFGVGRSNAERIDDPLFDAPEWSVIRQLNLRDKAAAQLGTVGSGNHYVDVMTDELDRVWVGVHFGSRGLGHGIATWALRAGGARDGMDVAPLVLDVNSSLGGDYLAAMRLAGEYAYAGRSWVAARVVKILGARALEEVHNHHNYAWLENHGGADLWVIRKGATPAWPGQKGFVGGSMGDHAVIIEGVLDENKFMDGVTDNERALFSTVHGAGRVMSRTAAKGKRGNPGAISSWDMAGWLKREGVTLRGADVDEAPQAYKRLPDVLAAHEGTIRVLHTLKPVGVAMAGKGEVDPYKD